MAETSTRGSFSFVHAADLHLDAPCKGLGQSAPQVAEALRDASLGAFDDLVRLCLEKEAAFLLLAGDIYDGAERGLRAQLRFRQGLQRLSEAGISTFVVHGNHDPVEEGWSAVERWPERVHFFAPGEVGAVEVDRDGEVLATIQGISFGKREVTENLALGFSASAGGGLQVGLLHCNVAGAADGYAAYSPCTLEELKSIGLDYWALGHIHQTLILSGRPGGGEPWVVYAGNLQARSRKPSDQGPKGAIVVEVREGAVASVEHHPCDRVRFAHPAIDVSTVESISDLHLHLSEQAQQLLAEAAGRSLVVRAQLSGRSHLHASLGKEGLLADLLAALRAECLSQSPWLWWDRLEDATLPPFDIETMREGDDFTADLLALVEELAGGTDELELIGKMPVELRKLAAQLLDEVGNEEILHRACVSALDRLDVGI